MKVIASFKNKSFVHEDHDRAWLDALTTNSTVLMDADTFDRNGRRPFPNRFNIVVVPQGRDVVCDDQTNNLEFVDETKLDHIVADIDGLIGEDVYVIGGPDLHRRFVGKATLVHAAVLPPPSSAEAKSRETFFFPTEHMHSYEILDASSSSEPTVVITYQKTARKHGECQYLEMLRRILLHGEARPDRTGTGTLAIFGHQLRFDISRSVPFLTTKALAWKTVVKELLWFLSGSTDSKVLESQGVSIWKANTSRAFLDARGLGGYREGDVGPLYPHALRSFGAEYAGCDQRGAGFDQLSALIAGLKSDPYSRRHVMTTFDPSVVDKCVLMPCHGIAIQFYVNGDPGGAGLSCHVYCRSSDSFLGLPFNIASYAVLTYLIAKLCGMKPNELVVSTGDTHVYANHVEQVKAQLTRSPLPFPVLVVSDDVLAKPIEEVTLDDFRLKGYVSHSAIPAPMAV